MKPIIPLSFFLALALLIIFPFLFSQLMVASLAKLHLSPQTALVLVIAIIFGGLINIPVRRQQSDIETMVSPLSAYGLPSTWPRLGQRSRETVIAVNFGGCVIPTLIALYEISRLSIVGLNALAATFAVAAINTAVCYHLAKPVPGLGILMPGLIPALLAAGLALLLAPAHAPAVAFVAGVMGPLIGADLLHLSDMSRSGPGVMSVGGAGTFDGIVLSGIVAAYLA